MDQGDHGAVVAAFERGEPVGGAAVTRIDTHAAHVFLAGHRAYKLKRPVRFSFLDFTTLRARRDALRRELELNRRSAPELYLDVVKAVRRDGRIALAAATDPAPALEWVLVMDRFPADAQLDAIAAKGPLDADLADALGRAVAELHAAAPPTPDNGGVAAMRKVVDGNRADLDRAPPGVFVASDVAAIDRAQRAALERLGALLERRRAGGFVRHCHGDLHLANLVRLGHRVVPVDCIEFDDEFARIDVAYDLAFLLMDLVHRGQRQAAQRVLQTYVDATDDVAGLALLPFFMAVRAVIRAKVMALADVADGGAAEARAYLALARSLEPAPGPMLVGIGGHSGAGKTTLARGLAAALDPAPGAIVVRSDIVRKRLAEVDPSTRLPPEHYTRAATAACYAAVRARAEAVLAAGFSAIVDAVHGETAERADLAAIAARFGVPFVGFWLAAPPASLVARVEGRRGDASDADAAVVRRQLQADPGPIAWHVLDASGAASAVVAAAKDRLRAT